VIPNLLAWYGSERLAATRVGPWLPPWLGRFALACAVGFATWSGTFGLVGDFDRGEGLAQRTVSLVAVLATLAGICAYALQTRRDVFPLAAAAGSAIFLSTVALGKYLDLREVGMFFALAAWLIASSTLSGHWLMKRVREWRAEGATA
jgi:hypothetical protein